MVLGVYHRYPIVLGIKVEHLGHLFNRVGQQHLRMEGELGLINR